MAALRASFTTKVPKGPKTGETQTVDDVSTALSPASSSAVGANQPNKMLEPLRIQLRRKSTGNGSYRPLTFPRSERSVEVESPESEKEDVCEPLANDPNDMCILPKPIYVISDCTGESAANTVRAALGQFQVCFQTSVPANLLVFRFLSDENKIIDIVQRAAKEGALIVFTLVDPKLVKVLRTACMAMDVSFVDLWSNLLDNMEAHLDTVRSGLPLGSPERKQKLSDDYFKMIEAVEFTRKMDDGAHPQFWHEADLVLLGVSRSGKTPLSIYLGQRGYKVANLPLVRGIRVPKQLYEIDQSKVFGLILDPHALLSIRKSRMTSLGVSLSSAANYAEQKAIDEELHYARSMYSQNPHWPVLDVTHSGVEETAARILKILSDRTGYKHPMWYTVARA